MNNEFIELVKTKKELNNMNLEQIIKYLNSLCTLNYYTGSCYSNIYDHNNILSIKLYSLIIELESGLDYLKYIINYCNTNDIFICSWIDPADSYYNSAYNEFIMDIESDLIDYDQFISIMEDSYYYEDLDDLFEYILEPYNIPDPILNILNCCISYDRLESYLYTSGGYYFYNGSIIEYY